MPLAGFVCPAGSPTVGQRNEGIEHCVSPTGCPHKCVSPPLLLAMWKAEHANHHVGSYLSASSLAGSGCARQTFFEREHAFYDTPRKRYWMFRGTVIHGMIEHGGADAAKYGWMQELRMAVPLEYRDLPAPVFDENGVWTGEFDSLRPLVIMLGGTCDGNNYLTLELHDYKTSGDAKILPFLKGSAGGQYSANIKDEWVLQTNIYAWLVAHTKVADVLPWFERHGLTPPAGEFLPAPTRLSMQLASMMEIPMSGTTYVPQRTTVEYVIEDVPMLPTADIEAFIRERALEWYQYLVLKQTPPVVAAAQSWMCNHCQFNGEVIPGERCHPEAERALVRLAERVDTHAVTIGVAEDPYSLHPKKAA